MVVPAPRRSLRSAGLDKSPNGCSGAAKFRDKSQSSLSEQENPIADMEDGVDEKENQGRTAHVAKPKRAQQNPSSRSTAKNLFDVAKHHPQAIKLAAQNWVKQYQDERSVAIAQILNLLSQGCGCAPLFSASVVDEETMDSLIDTLRVSVSKTQERDPLKGKGSKACRKNFSLTWSKIVLAYNAAGLTFDEDFVSILSTVLVPLTRDSIRCLRLTGSLAICEVVKAWLAVVKGLMNARETAQRHLTAEGKKRNAKRAGEKKSVLVATVDRCHQQVLELKKILTTFVDELLAHRYRDIDPEIRSMVISVLGCCCDQLPTEFLTTNYLKYIAWALSDRDGSVRLEAVKILIALYDKEDSTLHLKDFTERFKDRMCMLVNDINEEVATTSVKLVTKLVRANELSTDAICKVYKLLLDDVPVIRHAAAELVCELLNDDADGEPEASLESSSHGDAHMHGLLKLMDMLASLKDNDDGLHSNEHSPTVRTLSRQLVSDLADALHEKLDILQKLDVILRWLKDDLKTYSCTSSMQTHLVLLLESCAEKLVGIQGLPGDNLRQFKKRVKKHSASARVHEEVTLSLMREIGALLSKFQAEEDKIPSLVNIIQFMKLDLYTRKSDKETFCELLRKVVSLYFKHHTREVLDSVILTLVFAATHGPQELRAQGRIVIQELLDEILGSINSACKDVQANLQQGLICADKNSDPSDFLQLQTSIVRLHALLSVEKACELRSEEIYSTLNTALDLTTTCAKAAEIVTGPALECYELVLLWGAEEITHRDENHEGDLETLVQESGRLMNWVSVILNGEYSLAVYWEALKTMVDLYMVWSIDKVRGTKFASMGFDLDKPNFLRLWEVVEDKIAHDLIGLGSGSSTKGLNAKLPCWVASSLEIDARFVESLVDTITVVCRCVGTGLSNDCIIPLGGCMIQFLASQHDQVVKLVRATLRIVRRTYPEKVGSLYSQTMQLAFESVVGENGVVNDVGCKYFLDLCKKIAQTFVTSHTASTRSCVVEIVSNGIDYGVKAIRSRARFLEGCLPLVPKIHPSDAKGMVAKLQEIAEGKGPDEEDEAWSSFFALLDGLKGRASKKPLLGGLRKTGTTNCKDSIRGITFADDNAVPKKAETITEQPSPGDGDENDMDTSLQIGSGISTGLGTHQRISGGAALLDNDAEEYLSASELEDVHHSGSDSASAHGGSDEDGSAPSTPTGGVRQQGDLSSGTKRKNPDLTSEEIPAVSMDSDDMVEPPPRPKRGRK